MAVTLRLPRALCAELRGEAGRLELDVKSVIFRFAMVRSTSYGVLETGLKYIDDFGFYTDDHTLPRKRRKKGLTDLWQ